MTVRSRILVQAADVRFSAIEDVFLDRFVVPITEPAMEHLTVLFNATLVVP